MASSSSTSSIHPAPPVNGFRIRDRELFPRSFAVCRIVRASNKRLVGTGFLVEGDLVVTANHVISSATRIRKFLAQFFVDVFDNNYKGHFSFEVEFEDDPKKFFSSPAPNRVAGKYPPASAAHLDYSILTLKPDPRLRKVPYFSLFNEKISPFREQARAFVFQYPDELILDAFGNWISGDFQLATGTITKGGVNDYDVHYTTNSLPGSSGGPVTDEQGNLIALHHKGKITTCSCPKIKDSHCNAGVRIDKILEDLTISGRRQEIDTLIEQNTLRIQSKLTEHIANFYRNLQITSVYRGDWLFRIDDIYTDLVIIGDVERNEQGDKQESFQDRRIPTHETVYQPKTLIKIDQLFEQKKLKDAPKKRAIIYGVAGVGKTTFSEMVAIHGAELWKDQFKVVFLIKLRNLHQASYREKDSYSIEEVLAKEYNISLQNSTDASIFSSGFSCSLGQLREFLHRESFRKESLLILDGFDELPPEANNGQGPLRNVIKELEETFDHILITSRPGTVEFFNVPIDYKTEFEITGFDEKSIDRYITHFYEQLEAQGKIPPDSNAQDKIEKLRSALRERPILHNLVHIPINLTLACSFFNDNEDVFDSSETFTLTRFYITAVHWLYRRFLLRPGSAQSVSHDPKSDLTLHPTISPKHQIFQHIAWLAMQHDQVQIGEESVRQIFEQRNLAYDPDFIKDVGIMKFENGMWEFIHLTFQEYFTALYLANFYVGGIKPKEKVKLVKKGRKRLSRIKFDPRYTLTLWMTAGFLSHRVAKSEEKKDRIALANDKIALQTFFDRLFGQPIDLTRSHRQLRLFAQCFEECNNPENIQLHYSTFIRDCVKYIETADLQSVFELINRKTKLFNHEDIVNVIITRLNHPQEKEPMLQELVKLASKGQFFSRKLVAHLGLIAQDASQDASKDNTQIEFTALSILAEIAKIGSEVALDVMNIVEKLVLDKTLEVFPRIVAVRAFRDLSEGGIDIPLEIIHTLMMMLTARTLNDRFDEEIAFALGDIAQRRKTIIPELLHILTMIVREPNERLQGIAISVIVSLVEDVDGIPSEVWEALLTMLQDIDLTSGSHSLFFTLETIAKKGGNIAQKVVDPLILKFQDSEINNDERFAIEKILRQITAVDERMAEELLNSLVILLQDQKLLHCVRFGIASIITDIITENSLDISLEIFKTLVILAQDFNVSDDFKLSTVKVLGKIAETKGTTAQNALNAIALIVQKSGFHGESMILALKSIVGYKSNIPLEIFNTLVLVIEDENWRYNTKEIAISTLEEIAHCSNNIPQKVLNVLDMTLQDSNLDWQDKKSSLSAVGAISVGGGETAREAIHLLVKVAYNRVLESSLREQAVSEFRSAMMAGTETTSNAFNAIVAIIKDTNMPEGIRIEAVFSLAKVVANDWEDWQSCIPQEAWNTLIWVIQDPELGGRVIKEVLYSLKYKTQRKVDGAGFMRRKAPRPGPGRAIPQKVIHALSMISRDPKINLKLRIEALDIVLGVRNADETIASEAMKELMNLVLDPSLDSTVRAEAISAFSFIGKRGGAVAFIALTGLVNVLRKPNGDVQINDQILWAILMLTQEIKNDPFASEMVDILFGLYQDSNVAYPLRKRATENIGNIALQGPISQETLNAIVKSQILNVTGMGGSARALKERIKSIPQELLEIFLTMLPDSANNSWGIIEGFGYIVEQKSRIGQEALHALVMMGCYGNDVRRVLEEIKLSTLLDLITDIPSCQLVFLVCALTSRTFVIFEGHIYISDDRQQEFAKCPVGINVDIIERMGCSTASPATGSSTSSSSSSFSYSASSSSIGNIYDGISKGSAKARLDADTFLKTIAAVQLENPYHRLDDIFEGVYRKVLMSEKDLRALVTTLKEDEADLERAPKDLVVNYLVSQCIAAANQDGRFAELEKTFSYLSIAGLEKIACYYSIRESSWIEESLKKIGCFSPPTPVLYSSEIVT